MEERTAVRIVAEQLNSIPKSVMFIQSPTPIQIIGQLHMLTNHMKFVCTNIDCLDLEININQAEKCAETYLNKRYNNNIHQQLSYELLTLMNERNDDTNDNDTITNNAIIITPDTTRTEDEMIVEVEGLRS